MSSVCPTVTAYTVEDYREQIEAIEPFARRIHIDLGDGKFTTKTIDISDVWWPDALDADIHLMHEEPSVCMRDLLSLEPHMVILHAECKDELGSLVQRLHEKGIKAGVALLQDTSVESVADIIAQLDYVLIFSGHLGSFGGHADMALLRKVLKIRDIKPEIEIGWDGGINLENIRTLADGGIDVLNVGGAIQNANHPENAYRDLVRQLM